ncbi:hypothetical protein Taro_011242 [Colocasia esculenta]|uniref:Uncharacterized protein n=1 Tax=Colocasia esculenta TaxID=4460 RepID=A0A843U102_COLES|nr:hypothetical protein [Colocasia esculenta]
MRGKRWLDNDTELFIELSWLGRDAEVGTSVNTTWASVDTLSQNSPEGVLGRPLVSTLLELVSIHCPSLTRRALVSTLLGLVSTHCPKTAQKVVMRNQWSQMGQGKSDEYLSYE